ncbi:MMPL family transporter [Curvivirga aplysinae]|uniref:MMPL family transporter n=1 Tax=Curvivirga aplysinae TaxID=2529852 RepID=UPI0012BD177F|nr:hypothetical protein [Curvivirga aplysinae]MTI11026.1 hypothetical protein [Curvivirga aplysinae]
MRIAFSIWVICLALLSSFVIWESRSGLPINGDLLELLPSDAPQNSWKQQAKKQIAEDVQNRVLLVLSHEEKAFLLSVTSKLLENLKQAGLTKETPEIHSNLNKSTLFENLQLYRSGLLDVETRILLKSGQINDVLQQTMAQLINPFSILSANTVYHDPLLLKARWLQQLNADQKNWNNENGIPFLMKDGKYHALLEFQLSGSAFAPEIQQNLLPLIEQFEAQYIDLDLHRLGAIFYTYEGIEQGKGEATILGSISLIGVLFLVLISFRSAYPIFYALIAIYTGLVSGIAIVLFIHEQIYAFTLVFGVAILGVTVDYCFHYGSTIFVKNIGTTTERHHAVNKAMRLGMLSSVVGFFCFFFLPFPGLKQIGLFAITGLVGSYLTVGYVIPHLDRMKTKSPSGPLFILSNRLILFWQRHSKGHKPALILGGAIIAFILFIPNLHVNDDIRKMQSLSESLQRQEQHIQTLLSTNSSHQFFIVEGQNTQDVLESEEVFKPVLENMLYRGYLTNYMMVSEFFPSIRQQLEDQQLIQEAFENVDWSAYPLLTKTAYQDSLGQLLTPKNVLDKRLVEQVNKQILTQDATTSGAAHIIRLDGVTDIRKIQDLMRISEMPNVTFVDPAGDISASFAFYREKIVHLLGITLLLVTWLLAFKYGKRHSWRIVLPVAIAILLTPVLLSSFGHGFSFFTAVGLILVFALGMDYALFAAESSDEHYPISIYANGLSAISSALAFGLLVFSNHYALHTFGLTVLIGVTIAFVLAPLARTSRENI